MPPASYQHWPSWPGEPTRPAEPTWPAEPMWAGAQGSVLLAASYNFSAANQNDPRKPLKEATSFSYRLQSETGNIFSPNFLRRFF